LRSLRRRRFVASFHHKGHQGHQGKTNKSSLCFFVSFVPFVVYQRFELDCSLENAAAIDVSGARGGTGAGFVGRLAAGRGGRATG
jgi:hypothetical protein